jgi:DNA polymerase I-like protein with 3'-5' exonuclease and polymerase domains
MGDEHVAVTECCRGRIERDIEATKPLLVVTVGDEALRWATGVTATATQMRGSLFVAKFGSHVCHVYVIMEPLFAIDPRPQINPQYFNKYDVAFKHDIKWVRDNFDRLPQPVYHTAYDKGIEMITGDQPGDIHRLEKRLREIAGYRKQSLDLETTGLRPYMQRNPAIVTAAVGTFEDTLAFPLRISSAGHDEGWGTTAREQRAMELFAEWLQYSGRKACHHASFEMEWIEHEFGPEILRRTEWDDTMAMAYIMDSRPGTKSIDHQTRLRFGFFLKDQSPVNVKLDQWWLKYPLKTILRYNGMDTKWCDALRRDGEQRMTADDRSVYAQRMRLIPTLVLTEAPGLLFDEAYARKLDDEMRSKLRETERKLYACREIQDYERKHGHFEATNNDQVLKLMHGMLKRDECKREDRDGIVSLSTDEEVLSAIPSREVPSARLILDHREVSKLHGTYVLPGLQKKWVCRDGRIRSKYNSLLAVTSRLAAEDPNMTNWPKRKHREVRGMVIADRKHWLVPCDYGQIEFRVVGMASHDENLVKYCWTGYDVHKFWAKRVMKAHGPIIDWVVDEFHDTLATMKAKQGKEYDEDKAILKTLRQEMKTAGCSRSYSEQRRIHAQSHCTCLMTWQRT